MTSFREQADALLAVAGESTNAELIAAARKLRDVCAEHDEIDARFRVAAQEFKAILERA